MTDEFIIRDLKEYADKTTLFLESMAIRRKSSAGGRILYLNWKNEPQTLEVEPCPTGHAGITDDFMGGSVCLDCRSVW